jgi:D-threo-aldose 1-dehydrogenase
MWLLSVMHVNLPKAILGTSTLGNLYNALTQEEKTALIEAYISLSDKPYFFDTAGKYGAGLALECIGKGLKELSIAPEDVIISNKLGWYRVPLTTPEPTFEKDIWKGIKHDAVQKLGYDGILACFEQGNQLLGGYDSRFVSVHDPDEYLAAATDASDEEKRYKEILEAYRALFDLKKSGKADAVGVGAKSWRSIERLSHDIDFDWVMIANSMSVHSHPKELAHFMKSLADKNVTVINSAVFNGGFLTGGNFYNYQFVDDTTKRGQDLLSWRERFYELCRKHGLSHVAVALQFGLTAPGVQSIAIAASKPERLSATVNMVNQPVPADFWKAMVEADLLEEGWF